MADEGVQLEEERLAILRRSILGSALSEEALRAMVTTSQSIIHAGKFRGDQAILRQGEPGTRFHVLVSGRASVQVIAGSGEKIKVATFREGDCFGEMSLLTGDPVSADVIAEEDTETLSLDRDGFNVLVGANPGLLREFVRVISDRLRATDAAVGAAQEKEKELNRFLRERRADRYDELIGKEFGSRDMRRRIEEQAAQHTPLLIEGERGTGKELVGRLIHCRSPRKDGPLFSTDCSQMTETRWGDPLFGDYHRRQEGKIHPRGICYIDLAEGGTLLLKNLDAMPLPIQERLARYLEREPWEPGATRRHDVRIIATCRGNLTGTGRGGKVSPALVKAFSGHVLSIPPLRDHKRDIPEMAEHFLRRHAGRLGKQVDRLTDDAVTKLVSYHYRAANSQELEETIERAVILSDGPAIDAEAIFLGHPPERRPGGYNLLKLPGALVGPAVRLLPRILQGTVAVIFAFILYLCMFAESSPGGNLGTLLVWSFWWPTLVLSFFFLGRVWCAVCPMSLAGAAAQRIKGLDRRIPAWLKNHDTKIVMAGFFGIVWVEEVTGMRHSALATGLLLLFILGGALVVSVLFPRRTWCRHLCPLGGVAGLCSVSSIVELRPNLDICTAKCKGHSCYKGENGVPGCPMFNHVMFTDTNQHCVLCMNCVRSCPNDSPQLNLRVPARELLTVNAASWPQTGRFVAMLAGLLVGQMLIQSWEMRPDGPLQGLAAIQRFLLLTGMLSACAGVPLALLWLASPRSGMAGDAAAEERFWRKALAWLPLVTAGLVCYQLGFAPWLPDLRVGLALAPRSGAGLRSFSVSALDLLRYGTISAGLLTTFYILWKNRKITLGEGGKGWAMAHAAAIAGLIGFWGLILALMGSPGN